MIIGNGQIASAFAKAEQHADLIIFASGVSNSAETDPAAFGREETLLREALRESGLFVYFGSCGVLDPTATATPYVKHKHRMEELVGGREEHAIFRLPQVVGRTKNQHTLTNFLYNKIVKEEDITVWRHARRNLIDADDIAKIAHQLISSGKATRNTLNIANPRSTTMFELIEIFSKILSKKIDYLAVDAGSTYQIDVAEAQEAASLAGIDFDELYVERIMRKYYGR